MSWQIRISKEHEECVKNKRDIVDDEERATRRYNKRMGKEMVNQTAKQIIGSFDQGH